MPIPVPEHAVPLMACLSGGEVHHEDGYLFLAGDDWLMGVGYRHPDSPEVPDDPERFAAAVAVMRGRVQAEELFMMAPQLPAAMQPHVVERDVYYTLPATAEPPVRLRGPLRHAAEHLRVEESREFSPEHRRLWAEFLAVTPLNARVRRLYGATEQLVRQVPAVRLLNAWDAENRLTACLVLDYTLPQAVSYIIGAHSRAHYAPHASDLLFAAMLRNARASGKAHILLGLGVNAGITRFKRKWGGTPAQPYELAMWRADTATSATVDALFKAMITAPADMSKRQIFLSLPDQQPFAMLWRLDRRGRTSWIGGAAHFFCCSFERSLRALFDRVDTVLFEGPLDPDSLDAVARRGQSPEPGSPRVADFLDEQTVRGLERVVNGPFPRLARMLNSSGPPPADVRARLAETRPWYALFSLWTAYLERNGWANSVDMDAWNLALDMGKAVLGMESLAEQIASLESAPLPRIVRFMQQYGQWRTLKNRNQSAYLWGDLEGMTGTSAEFPTRTEAIIGVRDQRFRERMRASVEQGGTAVFVGTAHMLNLRHMLAEDGFIVTRELPTWKHRLRVWWLKDQSVVLRPPDLPDFPASSAESDALPVVSGAVTPPPALIPAQAHGASTPGSGKNLDWLSAEARVPEHILSYVRAVSPAPGPQLRECNGFAAWRSGASLVLVGFDPDVGSAAVSPDFSSRLSAAAALACREPGVERLTVLAPEMPHITPVNALSPAVVHRDSWWGLDLPAAHGQKLRNMIRRARRDVRIDSEIWTADHAALVRHYLHQRTDLTPGTRTLFAALENYSRNETALLLSARNARGALMGFTIGDLSALRTAFYLYAFRASDAPPGTADALLDALAVAAAEHGHSVLNLGLGVHAGIAFFKRKWQACELWPHVESVWQLTPC